MKYAAPIALLFLILSAAPASANSAIQCHCFQNRALDPSHPDKVDPYLLATTQNSFLSAVFGVNKAQVVRQRMSGTPAEDLWMAYILAQKTGSDPGVWLNTRRSEGSWKAVLSRSGTDAAALGPQVASALKSGGDQALSDAVADGAVSHHLGIKGDALKELRTKGASTQEIVLAAFLSSRGGRHPLELWSSVKEGETSWGLIASNLGVEFGKIEREFEKLAR